MHHQDWTENIGRIIRDSKELSIAIENAREIVRLSDEISKNKLDILSLIDIIARIEFHIGNIRRYDEHIRANSKSK